MREVAAPGHRDRRAGVERDRDGVVLDRGDAPVEQIRIADEIRDEDIGRLGVEFARRSGLRDPALMHQHHQVRHGQRLGLVVRDVDECGADAAVNALDLELHLIAQLLVEGAERLVHQQQARMRNQRPRHRHPLLLAAGQLARIAPAIVLHSHQRERFGDAPFDVGLRQLGAHLERKRDVVRNREMRKQRVRLEHHADVAVVRRHVRNRAIVEQNVAGIRGEKSGDQVEGRGLARSARPEQRNERAGRHIERDAVDRRLPAKSPAQIPQLDFGAARGRGVQNADHPASLTSLRCSIKVHQTIYGATLFVKKPHR